MKLNSKVHITKDGVIKRNAGISAKLHVYTATVKVKGFFTVNAFHDDIDDMIVKGNDRLSKYFVNVFSKQKLKATVINIEALSAGYSPQEAKINLKNGIKNDLSNHTVADITISSFHDEGTIEEFEKSMSVFGGTQSERLRRGGISFDF